MKILHCIATLKGGGAEKQLCYLVRSQIHAGLEVHVVILEEGVNYDSVKSTGAQIHKIAAPSNYSFRIFWHLRLIIKRNKPEIILCWQRPMDFFGPLAAILCKTPYIITERTNPVKYFFSFKGLLRLFMMQFSSAIVANSEIGKDFWKGKVINKKKIICYIPNILPVALQDQVTQSHEFDNFILSVGRLSIEKNHISLIHAFENINNPTINLIIVGEGPEYQRLIEIIREKKMTKRVKVIGYRSDVLEIMKAARGFVSLSLHEGMPNAVLEAASSQLPLLLSDILEHRSLFFPSEVLFCPPKDIQTITCLLNILVDRGTKRVYPSLNIFSEENIVSEFNLVFNKILYDN
jgi:glycosyltransferase involved in cell wall biosynthesis